MMFTSCVKEEEDLFDDSAAIRLQKEVVRYQQLLTGAPNGWVMEYFSDLGGYVFLCSFDAKGDATVALEGEEGTVTSKYRIITSDGPVLTFDTYNELFHLFSDPGYLPPDGYMGDYEFILMEGTGEKIVLSGKKHHDKIVMTPLPANKSWDDYFDELLKMEEESEYGNWELYAGNDSIGLASLSAEDRTFTFNYLGSDGVQKSESQRIIYTLAGVRLYEPVDINGTSIENFAWNRTTRELKCTDAQATQIALKVYIPEGYLYYEDFIGTYTFTFKRGASGTADYSTTVTVSEKVPQRTYNVNGAFPFNNFELTYSKTSGAVSIKVQDVGTNGSNTVRIAMMDPDAGYLGWSDTYSYEAAWNRSMDDFRLTFFDNGSFTGQKVNGIIYWQFNSSGASAGEYPSNGNSRFTYIRMTKQ
jgi:hypothetical protein